MAQFYVFPLKAYVLPRARVQQSRTANEKALQSITILNETIQ